MKNRFHFEILKHDKAVERVPQLAVREKERKHAFNYYLFEGGLCLQGFDYRYQADREAQAMRVEDALREKIEDAIYDLKKELVADFHLTHEDAHNRIKEYMKDQF